MSTLLSAAKLVGGGALLGVPWVSSLQRLNWHFVWRNSSQKNVFNGAASLVACIYYTAAMSQPPQTWMVEMPLWLGVVTSSVLLGVYLFLFYKYKADVANDRLAPLICAFMVYVLTWSVVAFFTRQSFIYRDYHVDGGMLRLGGKPLPEHRYQLLDKDGSIVADRNTDSSGMWISVRKRSDINNPEIGRAVQIKTRIENIGQEVRTISSEGIRDDKYDF